MWGGGYANQPYLLILQRMRVSEHITFYDNMELCLSITNKIKI